MPTLLAFLFLFGAFGRVLTSGATADIQWLQRNALFQPLLWVGVSSGVWYLWALMAGTFLNFSFDVSFSAFVVLATLVIVFSGNKKEVLKEETPYVFISVGFLLLLPVFWWAADDLPTQWDEFTHYMKNSFHLFEINKFFIAKNVHENNIWHPSFPLAMSVLTWPVHYVKGVFSPAVFAQLHLMFLVLAAAAVTGAAGVRANWSNILLAAGMATAGVALFNPFLDTKILLSAYADFPLALFLFVVAFPLLKKEPLPNGLAVVPFALALVFLVGIKQIAFYFVMFVLGWWLVRGLLEKKPEVADIGGYIILAGLPLAAHGLWQHYLEVQQLVHLYGGVGENKIHWERLGPMLQSMGIVFWRHPFAAAVILGTLTAAGWTALKVRSFVDVKNLMVEKGWLVFPAAITLYYIAGLSLAYMSEFNEAMGMAAQSFWRFLSHLQFVLMVPLWIFALRIYDKSSLKKIAWQAPWKMGTAVAGFFLLTLFVNEHRLNRQPIAPLAHTFRVAESLKEQGIVKGQNVAVIDSTGTSDLYAYVLGYGLRHHANIVEITRDAMKHPLPSLLEEKKAAHLWVHAPNETWRRLLANYELKDNISYLYRLENGQLVLQQAYPHMSYQQPYLK